MSFLKLFFFCLQKVLSLETPLLPFFVPVPIRHTLSPSPEKKKHKKKKFRDVYEFSMEKSGTEKRENKINIKNQCLLQSYIYNDNKNICKFK